MAVEQYHSQKVFVVGEVRAPGTYPLSGDMNLVEALARAGSTLPTASGEAIIVHRPRGQSASGPTLPTQDSADEHRARRPARSCRTASFSNNIALRDGDTIFVPRAESVYVFGQVKNPGAYAAAAEGARPCCRRCRWPAASPIAARRRASRSSASSTARRRRSR